MNRALEFFQEVNGGFSSIRLTFILVTLAIVAIWGTSSIMNKKIEDIPQGVYIFWGALATCKVAQRQIENKTPDLNE